MNHLTVPAADVRPARTLLSSGIRLIRRTGVLITVHLAALCVIFTEPTWIDWAIFVPFLVLRGFIITIGYHRYFSHRSFKTSRVGQFLLACLCCMNLENGPLWWAAVHRHHHRHSDDEDDYHSPVQRGFFFSHIGWLFVKVEEPDMNTIRDLTRFPELVWLERFWLLPPIVVGSLFYALGGWSCLCLDFFVTAAITFQFTFTVNSVAHLFGTRRYETRDSSRNSFLLAMFTMGDGWHNNHHHYPHSAQAGFFWYEVDSSYRVICLLERLGVVWDVRRVPAHKLHPQPAVKTETAVFVPEDTPVNATVA